MLKLNPRHSDEKVIVFNENEIISYYKNENCLEILLTNNNILRLYPIPSITVLRLLQIFELVLSNNKQLATLNTNLMYVEIIRR